MGRLIALCARRSFSRTIPRPSKRGKIRDKIRAGSRAVTASLLGPTCQPRAQNPSTHVDLPARCLIFPIRAPQRELRRRGTHRARAHPRGENASRRASFPGHSGNEKSRPWTNRSCFGAKDVAGLHHITFSVEAAAEDVKFDVDPVQILKR